MRPALYVAACIALVAIGWAARGWHEDSLALAVERATNATQLVTAEAIKAIEVKHTVIHNKVVEHTYHDPVYMDCRHTPDAWGGILEKFE